MASVGSLREHLVSELNDLLSAEQQLIEALPQMEEKASSKLLKTAFRSHLSQTRTHEKRLSQALQRLGEEAEAETCEAMKGLLREGEELMSSAEPGALLDAMLITAAQKVEHYEMATYGTVRTYAQLLGEPGVARLLDQTLREEKAADVKLTKIAEGGVNARAAKEWHEHTGLVESGTTMIQKGAKYVGSTMGKAVRRLMPEAADRGGAHGRARKSAGSKSTRTKSAGRTSGRQGSTRAGRSR